jgi:hypothetical protein
MRGVARTAVVAGTATAVSNRVSRRQGQRWAQQQAYEDAQYQQAAVAAAPPPAPAPAADAGADRIAALKELAELHSSGVLTDEEFAAEKAKLLNS